MKPSRIVFGYLAAPLIATSMLMLWGAVAGGSFSVREFPFMVLVYCIPHLLGTLLWMPFVLSRDPQRFGRLFYFGAGTVSGLLTATLAGVIVGHFFQMYLGFTISGALCAVVFREIAATGAEAA